jgi:predicted nucleic acid-binding protein
LEIDKGEASAITLAIEFDSSLLIIDDRKARKLAERLGLNYTGTLGVILRAKEKGLIPTIRPVLEKIQLTNFRFSTMVFNEILKIAGE